MPSSIQRTTGEAVYASPFLTGADGNNIHVKVIVSSLTSREVDSKGYLKPGVPLVRATGLLPTLAGDIIAAVEEQTQVATGNTAPILAAVTNSPFVACRVYGTINHDMLVSVLGAALTAGEITAFNGAGSQLRLTVKSV